MLGDTNAVATLAVRNLETAKKFYEGTIGLKPIDSKGDELIVFKSGKCAQLETNQPPSLREGTS
jgi:catechol-2,3-dioxygenase